LHSLKPVLMLKAVNEAGTRLARILNSLFNNLYYYLQQHVDYSGMRWGGDALKLKTMKPFFRISSVRDSIKSSHNFNSSELVKSVCTDQYVFVQVFRVNHVAGSQY
jgi:hypothetical protein